MCVHRTDQYTDTGDVAVSKHSSTDQQFTYSFDCTTDQSKIQYQERAKLNSEYTINNIDNQLAATIAVY